MVKSCLLQKKTSGAEKIAKIECNLTEDRSSQILPVHEKMAIFLPKIDFFALQPRKLTFFARNDTKMFVSHKKSLKKNLVKFQLKLTELRPKPIFGYLTIGKPCIEKFQSHFPQLFSIETSPNFFSGVFYG